MDVVASEDDGVSEGDALDSCVFCYLRVDNIFDVAGVVVAVDGTVLSVAEEVNGVYDGAEVPEAGEVACENVDAEELTGLGLAWKYSTMSVFHIEMDYYGLL